MRYLLVGVFVLTVLFAPRVLGRGEYNGSTGRSISTSAPSGPVLATTSPAWPSCTCFCAKSCNGDCVGSSGPCSLGQAAECIQQCCAAAPAATPEECQIN